jgi:hypothetical protein
MRRFFGRLGVFRTLPVFFVAGAAIEWFMIHVQVGKETFCEYRAVGAVYSNWRALTCSAALPYFSPSDDTLVRKEAERRAERKNQ